MSKEFSRILRPQGTAHQDSATIGTTSFSKGKSWVRELYDNHPYRAIRGSFGKNARVRVPA